MPNLKRIKLFQTGFTMVELLVVMSIISVLATLIVGNFRVSQARARDAQRKSDIKQYQTLLEIYAGNTPGSTYPSRTSITDLSTMCATLGVSGQCPTDPRPATQIYSYISNGSGGIATDATQYVVWATVETGDVDYWIVCSTGKVGTSGTVPNSYTCPI